MAVSLLRVWLFIIAATAFFATYNGYYKLDVLSQHQFSLKPEQVTPLAGHAFGAWTFLAGSLFLLSSYSSVPLLLSTTCFPSSSFSPPDVLRPFVTILSFIRILAQYLVFFIYLYIFLLSVPIFHLSLLFLSSSSSLVYSRFN